MAGVARTAPARCRERGERWCGGGGGGGVLGGWGDRMGVNQENIILTPYLCEDHWEDLSADCVCVCVLVRLSLQMILGTKTHAFPLLLLGNAPPPHTLFKVQHQQQHLR